MDSRNVWFPRYLDTYPQIGPFEADELLPFASFAVLGFLFNFFVQGVCVGVLLSVMMIKQKEMLQDGFLAALSYRFGLSTVKGYPVYFAEEFIE